MADRWGPRAWPYAVGVGLIGLLLFAWAPGPTTMTADEPLWLARAEGFQHALASGDLDHATSTLVIPYPNQTAPGVTTMWSGVIGERLLRAGQHVGLVADGPSGPPDDELRLRAGRFVVSLLCAVALGLFVVAAARLAGRRVAVVAGLLLAAEPWLVGHAGLLHTDAVVTLWSAVAIVAFAGSIADRSWRWHGVAMAGAAAGIAALTKANALPLIAGGMLVVLVVGLLAGGWRGSPRSAAIDVAAIAGIALAVIVVLWPAVWVSPIHCLELVVDTFSQSGAGDRTFYRGVTTTDPGLGYYPAALAVRLTPWLAVLAVAGVGVAVWRAWRAPAGARVARLLVVGVLGATVPYLLVITLASQRYDRYVLPVVPFLALAGGLCAVVAAGGLERRTRLPSRWVAALLVVLLVVPIVVTASLAPYSIAYVDPLVGGRRAERTILLGWGEGVERLGAEIDRRERGRCDDVDVLTFGLNLQVAVPCGRLNEAGLPVGRYDYAIRYVNQRQRHLDARVFRSVERKGKLVKSVEIGGVTYAELWSLSPPRS